jgi:hypothetical protein
LNTSASPLGVQHPEITIRDSRTVLPAIPTLSAHSQRNVIQISERDTFTTQYSEATKKNLWTPSRFAASENNSKF